jgi:hypothetical protein
MELRKLPYDLTVCKVGSVDNINLADDFLFIGKTGDEISLVCETDKVPDATTAREDGWRGFVICGVLVFALVGILAKVSTALAQDGIGLFAISTYNTDYILVKAENFERAESALVSAGYDVIQ